MFALNIIPQESQEKDNFRKIEYWCKNWRLVFLSAKKLWGGYLHPPSYPSDGVEGQCTTDLIMFAPTFGGGTLSIIPLWMFRTWTKVPTLRPELTNRMKSSTQLHPLKSWKIRPFGSIYPLCPSQLGSWIINRSQSPSKRL